MQAQEIITKMPYPIASVYLHLDDAGTSWQTKREAVFFTGYQLMRSLALPLVGQYFMQDLPAGANRRQLDNFNARIADIHRPFYSSWIALLNSLALRRVDLNLDFFDEFGAAMQRVKTETIDLPPEKTQYHIRKDGRENCRQNLTRFEALLGLRNSTAHSGMASDDSCREAVAIFRPLLDDLLETFAFLQNYELLVLRSDVFADEPLVQILRGAHPAEAQPQELTNTLYEVFKVSPVVMRSPSNRVQALFPFFHAHLEGEPLRYYDGHYLRDDAQMRRRTIFYLGNGEKVALDDEKAADIVQPPAPADAGERLREMLDKRKVPWQLKREQITPWTLRETVNDYARRTVEDLLNIKYLPECYLDRPKLSQPALHLTTTETIPKRAILFTGRAGSGKTALLTDLTRRLLDEQKEHLTFFVRGDGLINTLAGGNLLLANLQHKIGLKANEFPTFAELFARLQRGKKDDQFGERRFVIVLDALNESPNAAQIFREALELVQAARNYEWLRIVLSVREEFLLTVGGRREGNETNPFYHVRDLFVEPPDDPNRPRKPEDAPAWFVPSFELAEAGTVYRRYQTAKAATGNVRACLTDWEQLLPEAREKLLIVPFHLHLWMQTFDGREAPAMSGESELFAEYLKELRSRFDRFWESMSPILDLMLAAGRVELTDADTHDIEADWRKRVGTERARAEFSPIETVCVAGVMQKRITAEGGGYRIGYQRLREVLFYERLKELDGGMTAQSLEKWLQLPPTEELEGALAMIANDLWLLDRSAELAILTRQEIGLRVLERMVARRLEDYENIEFFAQRLKVMLNSLPSISTICHKISDSLLYSVNDKIAGFPVTLGLKTMWKIASQWLENLAVDAGWKEREKAVAFEKYGDILRLNGAIKQAQNYYQKSLEIGERIIQDEPYNTDFLRGTAVTYNKLGDLLKSEGEIQSARNYYEKSLIIVEKLLEDEPNRTDFALDAVASYDRLGDILIETGYLQKAQDHYRNSLAVAESLLKNEPHRSDLARSVAVSYNKLGDIFIAENGRHPQTKNHLEKNWIRHKVSIKSHLKLLSTF